LRFGDGTTDQFATEFGDDGDPVTRADVDFAFPFNDGAPKLNAARHTANEQNVLASTSRALKTPNRD
jgi:hypothetical protein